MVTIGVPAAVIVTVGAGALLMLTGRANEMLAIRASTGTLSPGATASPGASGTAQGGAQGTMRFIGVTLAGYPGQRGSVAADSISSAAGVTLAVGGADGHPAVWRQVGGAWTLVSAILGASDSTGNLIAVAHGPAGWIAVGSTAEGTSTAPLVLASADGVTWQPVTALVDAAGAGVQFLGVAAGPDGYAVVGRQMIGGRDFAALWWSADLRTWVQGANGGLNGRLTASTANAATATTTGFVAVGSHGAFASVWISPDGSHWDLLNISAPSGASSATLRQVIASGNSIVATGYAATAAGDIPLAVVSTDGGVHWREIILPTPNGRGVVTALTVEGTVAGGNTAGGNTAGGNTAGGNTAGGNTAGGNTAGGNTAGVGKFVAAGLTSGGQDGPDGAQRPVTWTSPDGVNWSAPAAVTGAEQITSLSAAASAGTVTGTGIAKQGANPTVLTVSAR